MKGEEEINIVDSLKELIDSIIKDSRILIK